MEEPFISMRKHIRWSSGDAYEPTNTLGTRFQGQGTVRDLNVNGPVLSGKNCSFVDARVFLTARDVDASIVNDENSLQWAFAGHSTTSSKTRDDAGKLTRWHSTWHHFVDSNSDDPAADEGAMVLQEDGTVLEKGAMINPDTGALEDYEELWQDLEVQATDGSGQRKSIVLRIDKVVGGSHKGMVVRVGTWCQGILKADGDLTVERWQFQFEARAQQAAAEHDADRHETGSWVRTLRFGSGSLPCEALCSESADRDKWISDGWEIIEDYSF